MDKRRYILSVLLGPGIIVVFAAKSLDYRKRPKVLVANSSAVLIDFMLIDKSLLAFHACMNPVDYYSLCLCRGSCY